MALDNLSDTVNLLFMRFRLKELRDLRDWNQEELASRCNTSFQNISRWERGDRGKQMADWLPKFAEALNVQVWELFISRKEVEQQILNNNDLMVLDAYRKMTPEQKEMLRAMLVNITPVMPQGAIGTQQSQ